VDYWALGITLYEMISGENPFYFDGMDQVTLYNAICQDKYYPLSGGNTEVFSASLHNLVEQLLEKDPIRRLGMMAGGMDDILNHEWFEDIDLFRVQNKRWPAPWKPTLTGDEQTECLIEMDTLSNIPLPLLHDSSHSLHASFSLLDDFAADNSPGQGDASQSSMKTSNEDSQSSVNNINDDSQSSFVDDCPSDKDSKPTKTTKSKTKTNRHSSNEQQQQQHKYFLSDLDRTAPPRKSKMEIKAEKEKSKSRRTTISATLAELGIDSDDEYQLF
jgi:serine/threonine protein kinase